ncbi:PspA/IM30 family protein [Pontibacter sp. G13]|uniref:PspA/IM30 family protein n=1 Tax=Pontibacter sp. G13 TaxID=3074898 RepID=UPI0028895B13|nr:PspA/IM30 family protein [Pontibacter sp. G13]WNJ21506.1 PspA/IM30 family protein [Pontibacter sp. G13]
MWKRFVRAMRSLFGGLVSSIEDPKLILEQNIRELNDQIPKMNENIATVKASVTLLEKELDKYKREYKDLVSKMKAAIQAGRDDIAQNFALRLESTKAHMIQTKDQYETAKKAYEKALEVKKVFMKQRERKIAEAKEALRAHDRAKWQSKIADTMESFEVAGIDATHDEMITRINEETARNEARMEMALDSVDTDTYKIEEEAENIRAADLVKQFKMEMGLDSDDPLADLDLDTPKKETE